VSDAVTDCRPTLPKCSVVFWDIDGTLLTTGQAGILAWEDTLREVCRVDSDLSDLHASGFTDGQIADSLHEHYGSGGDKAAAVDVLLRAYERRLPDALRQRQGRVLPGVVEILDHLAGQDDVVSSLLTGNTPAGARAKLAHYRLMQYFPGHGAFCLGLGQREEIARRAYWVAEILCGESGRAAQIYVVGDTPRDVRCGRAIGARTIGVASGIYRAEQLAAAGSWVVLEALPRPDRFADLLTID
jgi:phosphoglycolate phosphatase